MIKITDDLVRQNNARILACIPLLTPTVSPKMQESNNSENKNEGPANSEEKALLWDIHNRPFLSTTERYKTINLGG